MSKHGLSRSPGGCPGPTARLEGRLSGPGAKSTSLSSPSTGFSWASEVVHLQLANGEVSGPGMSAILQVKHSQMPHRSGGFLFCPQLNATLSSGSEVLLPGQQLGLVLPGSAGASSSGQAWKAPESCVPCFRGIQAHMRTCRPPTRPRPRRPPAPRARTRAVGVGAAPQRVGRRVRGLPLSSGAGSLLNWWLHSPLLSEEL